MKLRSAVKNARSGVRWRERRVLIPGNQAQQIDQVVPFTAVFDNATSNLIRVAVLNPATGQLLQMRPPPDVLAELSSQVYGLVLRKIGFDLRKFYQGVPADDGFALIRQLRSCQAEERAA